MTRLYLLRHGIAVPPGTDGIADDDRPLTARGETRVRQVAHGLRLYGLKLDRIVSSPVPRALRTAEIVAEILEVGHRLGTDDALRPGRDAASIRDWLQTVPERRLLLVGHNPALSDLVGLLITGEPGVPVCELRKAGIAALAGGPEGGLRIEWLARPRLVRRLVD